MPRGLIAITCHVSLRTQNALTLLVDNQDQFPVALQCTLGQVGISKADDSGVISAMILASNESGDCPAGVYALNGRLFRLADGAVSEMTISSP